MSRADDNMQKAKDFWRRVIRGGEKAPVVGSLPPEQEPSHGFTVTSDESTHSETRVEEN